MRIRAVNRPAPAGAGGRAFSPALMSRWPLTTAIEDAANAIHHRLEQPDASSGSSVAVISEGRVNLRPRVWAQSCLEFL